MDSAWSRVGSAASTSTWLAGYSSPPTETTFGCSLSLPLANSLIRRPAAPGSSVENAYSRGPTSLSLTHSYSVPSMARTASVFLTTFKKTPSSRAFLRMAVICATVVPAYSAATRECALAATSASSATTSCFWDRLRAIHSSLIDSARDSCRLRSWTASGPWTPGTRRSRVGGLCPLAVRERTRQLPEGGTIYAGRSTRIRLSGPAATTAIPCQHELHARRRCALTAPAVFDGCRHGSTRGDRPQRRARFRARR